MDQNSRSFLLKRLKTWLLDKTRNVKDKKRVKEWTTHLVFQVGYCQTWLPWQKVGRREDERASFMKPTEKEMREVFSIVFMHETRLSLILTQGLVSWEAQPTFTLISSLSVDWILEHLTNFCLCHSFLPLKKGLCLRELVSGATSRTKIQLQETRST